MAESARRGQGGPSGMAQSASRNPKESLERQAHRVHAFLDTVKLNKTTLSANAGERLRQGLDNVELYEQTVTDFENRVKNCDPAQVEQMELEWAQKVKSMCDSGLDAVIAIMKKATAQAGRQQPQQE